MLTKFKFKVFLNTTSFPERRAFGEMYFDDYEDAELARQDELLKHISSLKNSDKGIWAKNSICVERDKDFDQQRVTALPTLRYNAMGKLCTPWIKIERVKV